MLTVTGMIYVASTPEERRVNKGTYFNFDAVSKHPVTGGKVWSRIAVFVNDDELADAREKIVKNRILQIRFGQLDGNKPEGSQFVRFQQVKTAWRDIQAWKLMPE